LASRDLSGPSFANEKYRLVKPQSSSKEDEKALHGLGPDKGRIRRHSAMKLGKIGLPTLEII